MCLPVLPFVVPLAWLVIEVNAVWNEEMELYMRLHMHALKIHYRIKNTLHDKKTSRQTFQNWRRRAAKHNLDTQNTHAQNNNKTMKENITASTWPPAGCPPWLGNPSPASRPPGYSWPRGAGGRWGPARTSLPREEVLLLRAGQRSQWYPDLLWCRRRAGSTPEVLDLRVGGQRSVKLIR